MRNAASNVSSRSILLVDDNKADYEAAKHAFREAELHTPMHWCQSGQEALDFLERVDESNREFPSFILLDLHMPGLDGYQTLQRIKEHQDYKSIPVIMMTSSNDERDIAACYQMGANSYLQKPSNFTSFVETAKRLKAYWFDVALLPSNKH